MFEGVGVLSGPCPGCPSHEPWGRTADGYATSMEAAYPRLLCDRILQCVDVFAAATDAAPTSQAVTPLAEARAAAQKQPRGRRFAPIISEFSHTVSVQASCPPVLDHKNCLTAVWRQSALRFQVAACFGREGRQGHSRKLVTIS